jgi:hypothetical protein
METLASALPRRIEIKTAPMARQMNWVSVVSGAGFRHALLRR